jgi:hypothetical protein
LRTASCGGAFRLLECSRIYAQVTLCFHATIWVIHHAAKEFPTRPFWFYRYLHDRIR